ncbi:MAG: DUF1990 domain-containing protein [Acidobacteriota bacterium]
MFLLTAPTPAAVDRFLADREGDTFSYAEIGATLGQPPDGYNIDHNRVLIGEGCETYERARIAIRQWKMFDMPWTRLLPDDAPIEVGTTVAIAVRHFGFYSLNAARIVYTIDEESEIRKFGFAYGTLTEHGEIGEERFTVEFDLATGEVCYDLYAFSQPGALLARIGYPLSRYLQKAFAQESKVAMLRAVSVDGGAFDPGKVVVK